jgi:hypothetical protein
MPIDFESFTPDKKTLSQILSNTSPPIRVPDFQRDFSWTQKQISEFWSDLIAFGGNDPAVQLTGREYFLGAAVLVNNGTYHLLLDGQQRLATTTILLAALRDKIAEFNQDAAKQINEQYIVFEDHLTNARVAKIELNIFDRAFFRNNIQTFPRQQFEAPAKKSHRLIREAYDYFEERISEGWENAGGGRSGFDWAAHITLTLREHMALVTVVSNNERSASLIFATLNDRGIGLSTIDLIRSLVLQRTHVTKREEVLKYWDEIFEAAGPGTGTESLIRFSWVAQHGDVKARTLYKVVSDSIPNDEQALVYSQRLRQDALLYRQYRTGDTDDTGLRDYWVAHRTLRFNAGYPLLLACSHKLNAAEQKNIARAVIALVIRHNIVCNLDRARLESTVFSAAKRVSDGEGFDAAVRELRSISPNDETFDRNFQRLAFGRSNINIARYMLGCIEDHLSETQELSIAGSERVHVEHIYPQTPAAADKWNEHEKLVSLFGNLTLLDRRLNESINNAGFARKKNEAYQNSRLRLTSELLETAEWTPAAVAERQQRLAERAKLVWPESLIT